jgi:hypothetical protein
MIDLPDINHNPKVADWVELYVTYNYKPISKSKLIKEIQKEYQDLSDDDTEQIVDTVFLELSNRTKFYGTSCPFQISGNVISPSYKWSDFPEHTMCLIFSLYGVLKKRGENDGTKYFEQISNVAIKSFFNCETLILGFPNKTNLTGQVNAFIKDSLEQKGHKVPRSSDKDKGVDIIAWKSFQDNRNNQFILFMQCGAGYHFNQKKPIDLYGWRRIVDFRFEPMTGIAIPSLINDNYLWEDISSYYKIVFDRARIIKNLYNSIHIDNDLRKKVKTWCRKRLN